MPDFYRRPFCSHIGYMTFVIFTIYFLGAKISLRTGITPNLTILGKIALIITMFIGRVGPLTISTAIIAKAGRRPVKYPMEDIFIG